MMKNFVLFLFLFCGLNVVASSPVRDIIRKADINKKFPGADHIVVFDSIKVEVQESGLSYYNEHKLIKILTPEGGKKFNAYKYNYDPLSAYAEIRKVVIHYNNGKKKSLISDNELDYPAPARTILWGARQKMIELGRLEKGDAFEVFLFKKGFTYALLEADNDDEKYIPPMRGHFYDIVPFWSSVPTLSKVYQVSIPNTKKVNYKVYNGKIKISKQNFGEKTLYDFSKKNIFPVNKEPDMVALSDVATKLLISTSPDWYTKSKWFYHVNEDYGSFESTPVIDKKVKEILKRAASENDSVSLLTHWVADEIRYFGLTMGKGEGYTLHKGSMTFRDRCGVCKDKAGMLVTMLRSAGFEAYACMTMAGSRIDYIAADQFNHSVTIVRLSDGKLHLLDPTWVPFVRELWSSAEQQQNYLPGLPQGSDLLKTPVSPPQNHFIKIKANSDLQINGTLTGEISVQAEGQSDARLRRMFTGSYKSLWEKNLENELLKIYPQAKIIKASYPGDPYNYMAGPIFLKISFKIPDYAIVSDSEIMFTPVAASGIFSRAMRHLSIDLKLEERKYPFRDACSQKIEIEDVTKIPTGYEIAWIPELQQVKGSGASFDAEYKLNNGKFILNERADFNKRIYEPEDWDSFREAVKMQKKIADNPVILKIGK